MVSTESAPATLPAAPHGDGGACADCHAKEASAWAGSQHDLAMGEVAAALAHFDGVTIAAGSLSATPLLEGRSPAVRVQDLAGARTLPVVNTFGVFPLQQYLLQGEGGRLLVAPVAWDVAGERWFDPSVQGAVGDPEDPLYWAGLAGTWNHECAECHSTGVDKGYALSTESYETRYQAIDVSCGACHGDPSAPQVPSTAAAQLATCGPCHSRRARVAAPGASGEDYLDHYSPVLLDGPTYAADGGIKAGEEAFVLGSWLQGKMHAAGLKCTDCHDPHRAKPLVDGDLLCTRCHVPDYDTPAHRGHPQGGPGSACVDCHMPQALYMGIDQRRDHYIRSPTPALSETIGATDACTGCHSDRGAAWSQAWLDARGVRVDPALAGFVRAVAAARAGAPGATEALVAAASNPALGGFRRASALALLRRYPPRPGRWLGAALSDPDPLLRAQATATAGAWGLSRALGPQLMDPVRAVRVEAMKAALMGGLAPSFLSALDAVIAEYKAAAEEDGDLPSTHSNLGVVLLARGDTEGARAAFRDALALEPGFPPAVENLAAIGGDAPGE